MFQYKKIGVFFGVFCSLLGYSQLSFASPELVQEIVEQNQKLDDSKMNLKEEVELLQIQKDLIDASKAQHAIQQQLEATKAALELQQEEEKENSQ